MAKKWTEKEEKFLKANLKKMSAEDLGKKFGVSAKAVKSKLARLGLKKSKPAPSKPQKKVKPRKAATRDTVHDNIRCRQCLIVDGYTTNEKSCRHCGAQLFKEVL